MSHVSSDIHWDCQYVLSICFVLFLILLLICCLPQVISSPSYQVVSKLLLKIIQCWIYSPFSFSIKNGEFPNEWKLSRVIPIFKSGATDQACTVTTGQLVFCLYFLKCQQRLEQISFYLFCFKIQCTHCNLVFIHNILLRLPTVSLLNNLNQQMIKATHWSSLFRFQKGLWHAKS